MLTGSFLSPQTYFFLPLRLGLTFIYGICFDRHGHQHYTTSMADKRATIWPTNAMDIWRLVLFRSPCWIFVDGYFRFHPQLLVRRALWPQTDAWQEGTWQPQKKQQSRYSVIYPGHKASLVRNQTSYGVMAYLWDMVHLSPCLSHICQCHHQIRLRPERGDAWQLGERNSASR